MAGLIPVPVIQKEEWAQCENPNCQKWRKLPRGVTINENESWYCYMNPDNDRNTCSASEVEYDETKEFVIAGDVDPEETARNQRIMQELEASIAAAAIAKGRGGRGRTGRSRGRARGRGRPPLSNRIGGVVPVASAPLHGFGGLAAYRQRSVSFAEDHDEPEDSDLSGATRGVTSRLSKKQVLKILHRLLDNQGQWEAARSNTMPAVLPPALPSDAWDALGQAAPQLAETACAAADLSSSMSYFYGQGAAASGAQIEAAVEVGAIARLSVMMAAASGLVMAEDSLSKDEHEKLGFNGDLYLPEVIVPASVAGGFAGPTS